MGLYTKLGFCLEPDEPLVVANSKMEGRVDIAHYYMDHRLIPKPLKKNRATQTVLQDMSTALSGKKVSL